MNNTKEEKEGFPWSVIILAIAAFVIISTLIYLQIPHHPEEEHLQNTIDNMNEVTDEYRQGWNDCIKALHKFNRMATNMTGSITT